LVTLLPHRVGSRMVVAEKTLRSFRFSTAGPPTTARGAVVRELHERGVIPLEPLPGRTAHVDIGTWFLPGACIMTGTLSGLRQHASPQAIGASDDLFVGVNLAGRSAVAQRGHEITLKSGDAALLSSAEGPFTIDRPTPVRFLGVGFRAARSCRFSGDTPSPGCGSCRPRPSPSGC
jgi:hypothetical protein